MEIENRELSVNLIQNIEALKSAINEISVYDLNTYTAIELYYRLANKLNEVINGLLKHEVVVSEEIIKQNECLQYLLNDGLKTEVVDKLNTMIADGTMDELINQTAMANLNNKILKVEKDLKEEMTIDIKDYKMIKILENIKDPVTDTKMVVEIDGMKTEIANVIHDAQPILTYTSTAFFKDPFIIKDNDKYYMFMTVFDGDSDIGGIGYATSTDLIEWTVRKKIINKNNCWGNRTDIGCWAPYVTKKQSDGYYYMFVCGVDSTDSNNSYRTGVLKSSSLTTGWTWVDYIRNNEGEIIKAIDPDIIIDNGKCYLYLAVCNPTKKIILYSCDDDKLTENKWTFERDIIEANKGWEKGLVEAFQCVKVNKNQYVGFYGGNGSDAQMVGICISNKPNGDFRKIKRDGMFFLEIPTGCNSVGHPHVFFDEDKRIFYLFCFTQNMANGKCSILGYSSKDLNYFKPLKETTVSTLANGQYLVATEEESLYASNFIYEDGFKLGRRVLGQMTSNGFVQTGDYKIVEIVPAKKEIENQTNTSYETKYSYISHRLPIYDMAKDGNLFIKLSCMLTSDSPMNIELKLTSGDVLLNSRVDVTRNGEFWDTDWVNVKPLNENGSPRYMETINFVSKCDSGTYKLHDETTIIYMIRE